MGDDEILRAVDARHFKADSVLGGGFDPDGPYVDVRLRPDVSRWPAKAELRVEPDGRVARWSVGERRWVVDRDSPPPVNG